ncbi:MAG: aminopeptidase P family protein [Ruminococcaceae bacterium]|nr:aminopeptidase P family protein [Oscillospiraceae bacterium]
MHFRRIQALQRKVKADYILICSPENLFYYSGFTGGEGTVLLGKNERLLFTDSRYIVQAKQEAPDFEIKNVAEQKVSQFLAEKKATSIGYEAEFVTAGAYLRLCEALPGAVWLPVDEEVLAQRAVKDAHEFSMTCRAAELADEAFTKVLPMLKPGTREKDVALALEWEMRKNGAQGASFEIICASGVRSAMPHGVAGEKIMEKGDFVTLDFGCFFEGYASDMTRTVVLGRATEEQRNIYETVLRAQKAGLSAIRAGITGKEADAAARSIIEEAGYGENFGHSLGHGTGLMIHEAPTLSPRSEKELSTGMLVTVEPGIYVEGLGGVRIEDLVCVQQNGHLNLTKSDKELLEL